MKCEHCGAEIYNNSGYCNACNNYSRTTFQKADAIVGKTAGAIVSVVKGIVSIVVLIVAIVVVYNLAVGNNGSDTGDIVAAIASDQKKIDVVKEGSFVNYPDKTIGDAFEDFFAMPIWTEFEATTGEQVVQFNGKCIYEEKTVTARLQFIVHDDGTFETGALSFNDISQNKLMLIGLLNKIYQE